MWELEGNISHEIHNLGRRIQMKLIKQLLNNEQTIFIPLEHFLKEDGLEIEKMSSEGIQLVLSEDTKQLPTRLIRVARGHEGKWKEFLKESNEESINDWFIAVNQFGGMFLCEAGLQTTGENLLAEIAIKLRQPR